MKNIVFFRISLALVCLLCSGGQANYSFPISGKVKNLPNFTAALDKFDLHMRPMFFDFFDELFKSMAGVFDSLAELNTDIVKRTARNANTDRTKLPENINVTIKYNNVTESHTQSNIYYSMINNSTSINDRLINNDTYVNKFYNNLSCIFSSCPEYLTKRNNSNQIPRLVFIFSEHTRNIYFMIKNNFSEQYNKIIKKLHTVYITLLPRSFIASIVPGIKKYWLIKRISTNSITGDVVLYVSLVVFCGMVLFVAFMTIKAFSIAIRQLWNSRRKLKPQKEDVLFYMV